MDKEVFKKGLEDIQISFDGFKITKEKAELWYGMVKSLENNEWKEKIYNCILYCRRNPSLADILDHNDYYTNPVDRDTRERAMACKRRNPGCYQGDRNKDTCDYCMSNLRG